jgi:hypothetical protein
MKLRQIQVGRTETPPRSHLQEARNTQPVALETKEGAKPGFVQLQLIPGKHKVIQRPACISTTPSRFYSPSRYLSLFILFATSGAAPRRRAFARCFLLRIDRLTPAALCFLGNALTPVSAGAAKGLKNNRQLAAESSCTSLRSMRYTPPQPISCATDNSSHPSTLSSSPRFCGGA